MVKYLLIAMLGWATLVTMLEASILISRGRPVSQSSTDWNGPPFLAIDGNRNQQYQNKSCSHTKSEKNPWWKLDFRFAHKMNLIKIWNRADCCGERLSGLLIEGSRDDKSYEVLTKLNSTKGGEIFGFPISFVGRFIRLSLNNTEPRPLTLCEVEVYGTGNIGYKPKPTLNLARPLFPSIKPIGLPFTSRKPIGLALPTFVISKDKVASQSSVDANGPPQLAIDGNNNQNYFTRSCTHTKAEKNPWWKLDLLNLYGVTLIKVWNRKDCCGERLRGLKIEASRDGQAYIFLDRLNKSVTGGEVLEFRVGVVSRYIRLSLSNDVPQPLTLCEVEVHGHPLFMPKVTTTSAPKCATQQKVKSTVAPKKEETKRNASSSSQDKLVIPLGKDADLNLELSVKMHFNGKGKNFDIVKVENVKKQAEKDDEEEDDDDNDSKPNHRKDDDDDDEEDDDDNDDDDDDDEDEKIEEPITLQRRVLRIARRPL